MSTRRLASAVATLAVSAAAAVSFAAPALAQQGPGCPNPGGQYPPGQDCPAGAFPGQGRGVSDGNPAPGERMSANSGRGSFDPGSRAEYGVESTYIKLGETTVNADGMAVASFELPTSLAVGQHHVVFRGIKDGAPATVRVPFTLTAAAAGGAGGGTANPREGVLGALPRTGADAVVPMAATGIALVAVGAGVVLVARKRRQELDSSLA